MQLHFTYNPKAIKTDCFQFGNIKNDYEVNSLYFTLQGKPFIPISGEFHFSRYDHREWRTELLKMRASGINAVATYIFWNHHEYNKGEYNFSGNMNIKKFLSVCKEINMPCIMRIGPWAHGECVYGGFPPFIQKMVGKRSDNPKYLAEVEVFWRKLYSEVSDFCDGKTIVGIQLENEYCGKITHIRTLRELAIKVGFKTCFFTMTAWPTNTPDTTILPTFGGYPEAPWTMHKRPLAPARRFAICSGRTETDIGEDLIRKRIEKVSFEDFPYAGCEVGTGNQVSAARRPLISDKDCYGVPFAKFASGMNWMGYYMYHGGRNPNNHLYQESRRTQYPNNYPIIDYDFQSPFSKNGVCRQGGHLLRLMHTFIATWDSNLALKQTYFAQEKPTSSMDNAIPYCSVRCDESLNGYAFLSNYERGRKGIKIKDVALEISDGDKKIVLPKMDIADGAMFFFPFNCDIGGKTIDYIWAQPITKINNTYYFVELPEVEPQISIQGHTQKIKGELQVGNVKVIVLTAVEALRFYNINGKAIFADGTLYEDNGNIKTEIVAKPSGETVELKKISAKRLPYNHYLYSYGKRHYYSLKISKQLLQKYYDLRIEIAFTGLNLQVFSGNELVDDYFNTDGIYSFQTRLFKERLLKNNELIIKAVPGVKFGVGKVYNEINIPVGSVELKVKSVSAIELKEIKA